MLFIFVYSVRGGFHGGPQHTKIECERNILDLQYDHSLSLFMMKKEELTGGQDKNTPCSPAEGLNPGFFHLLMVKTKSIESNADLHLSVSHS